MSPLFLFIFITISLLLIACFASPQYKTETIAYSSKEAFGNNDYPDFGRPIHIILPTACRKAYLSYQAPGGHGELGCTQVPCPNNAFEMLPKDVQASMPKGFQSNVSCWRCCNYDNYSNFDGRSCQIKRRCRVE
jgi:hypothetical protein